MVTVEKARSTKRPTLPTAAVSRQALQRLREDFGAQHVNLVHRSFPAARLDFRYGGIETGAFAKFNGPFQLVEFVPDQGRSAWARRDWPGLADGAASVRNFRLTGISVKACRYGPR